VIDTEAFLAHYGKKGMRWGVRRKRAGGAVTSKEHKRIKDNRRKTASSDYKKVSEIKKKPIPQLTNKQLEAANKRMNLEQNFSRMNPGKVEKGQKRVKAILAVGATVNTALAFANSPAGQTLAKNLGSSKRARNINKEGKALKALSTTFKV
jgi:predicted RNA-binding protein Jag